MKKFLILLLLSCSANAYDLSGSFNKISAQQAEIDKLDSLVDAIEFKVKDVKPLKEDAGSYYISVIGDLKYNQEWVDKFEDFINKNPQYKSCILKTERSYAFAKIKYKDKVVVVKSPNWIQLKTRRDSSGELDFSDEGEMSVVFGLDTLDSFDSIEIYFKSAQEISREKGVRF